MLKAGGLMIHILPSVTWRWWTILVRYLWIIRSVVFRLNDPEIPTPKPATPYTPAHLLRFVWSITFPHAHGVYSNAIRKRLAKLLGSSCSIYVVCEP